MNGEVMVLDHYRGAAEGPAIEPGLLKLPVVFCDERNAEALRRSLPETLQVWCVVDVEPYALKVETAANQIVTLRRPPLIVLGLLASDAAMLAKLTAAAEWLGQQGMRAVPAPLAAAPNAPQPLAEILAQFARLLTAQAECMTGLSRDLAKLRISNEQLQNNFSALEGLLSRRGLQPYDLDFVNEPVDCQIDILKEAAQQRVTQILSVGSRGVSAVGIHFTGLPARGHATVKVQVTSLEDGLIVDTWKLSVSDLREGWNVFGFKRTLAGPARTLELSVSGVGERSDLPLLSLGSPQPIERFRVHDGDSRQSLGDASLALQVWTGLAAVALPSWATYWSSQRASVNAAPEALQEEAVSPDVLGFTTLLDADGGTFNFPAVRPLVAERAIACHPPTSGMTVARIPGACRAGALRVSASALIDNPKARQVEFALATTSDSSRARALLNGATSPGAGESVSTWIRVEPGTRKQINAFIAQPVAHWQDIFVATRMAEPGNNNFAWAKIQHISSAFQDLG